MLPNLTTEKARSIARLAADARRARDLVVHGVAEEFVEGPHPSRGERDRAASSSFDVMAPGDPALGQLRRAIETLGLAARTELFVLMRIGQGELAPGDWERGVSEASALGPVNLTGILCEDIDLESHLSKALYEIGAHTA